MATIKRANLTESLRLALAEWALKVQRNRDLERQAARKIVMWMQAIPSGENEALADELGVSPSRLSEIKANRRGMSDEFVAALIRQGWQRARWISRA
jgi:hypothetical protein